MNITRQKNIYTLGPTQRSLVAPRNRRSQSDVFEKDPFKVQSYKFHYADRPRSSPYSRPLNPKNSNSTHSNNNSGNMHRIYNNSNKMNNGNINARNCYDKRFETHYLNRNFSKDHNDDNNVGNYNKSFENRRRKFVQEYRNPFRTSVVNIPNSNYNANYNSNSRSFLTPTISPFLKSICNRADMKKLQPCNSRSSVDSSIGSLHSRKSSYGLIQPSSTNSKKLRASKSLKLRDNSVCQININIKRTDDKNSPNGNFTIEIETEKKNDLVKINNSVSQTNSSNLNLSPKRSFLGPKSISKLSVAGKSITLSSHSLQRTESSTSSAGQLIEKTPSAKRLPSLVPWRSYGSRECFHNPEPDGKLNAIQDLSPKFNRPALHRTNSSLCAFRGSTENIPRLMNSYTNFTNNLNRPDSLQSGRFQCPTLNLTNEPIKKDALDLCNTNDLSVIRPIRSTSSGSTFVNIYGDKSKPFRL